jgi:hypothetical protein
MNVRPCLNLPVLIETAKINSDEPENKWRDLERVRDCSRAHAHSFQSNDSLETS